MTTWDPIPVLRGTRTDAGETVTIAWRKPGRGKPTTSSSVAAINISRRIAEKAGWSRETTRIVAEVDRASWRLRLRPAQPGEAHARSLQNRTGTRSATVPLAWVESGPRPAAPVRHQVDGQAIIIDLPAWASGTRTARPTDQGRTPIADPSKGARRLDPPATAQIAAPVQPDARNPTAAPRGSRAWTPEQRAALSARMRALHAAKKSASRPRPVITPAESERAIEDEARAGKSAREIAAALAIPLTRASELVLLARVEAR
jgi:hypothetical protein